jgi:hypothetical protein
MYYVSSLCDLTTFQPHAQLAGVVKGLGEPLYLLVCPTSPASFSTDTSHIHQLTDLDGIFWMPNILSVQLPFRISIAYHLWSDILSVALFS